MLYGEAALGIANDSVSGMAEIVATTETTTYSLQKMPFSRIKIIITDLDGTFLNSRSKVSKRNASAFRAAKQAGYTVLVATGRSRASTQMLGQEILKEMNYIDLTPGIFFNGLCVYGKDELLYESSMRKDHLKLLVDFLMSENMIKHMLLYEGPDIYCFEYNNYTSVVHLVYGESKPCILTEINMDRSYSKIVLSAPSEDLLRIKSILKKNYDNFFECFHTLSEIFEIMPKGANKWTGAQILLDNLGVEPSEVMFVGDSENDCELLKNVGWPIAVANACEDAKRIAKHVVRNHNEDAFAEVIELFCNII